MRSNEFPKTINMAMFNTSPFYLLQYLQKLILTLFILCIFMLATIIPALPQTGVIGSDDRVIISEKGTPWSAVGQVNISGYRNRVSCTGALIAPDIVLTAAHCLINSRSGGILPIHHMHFLAGVNRGQHLGYSKVKCVHIPEYLKSIQHKGERRKLLENDFAVLVLKNKLKVPPLSLSTDLKEDTSLIHPSYPRDRRHILSAHFNCKVLKKYRGIWTTNCDTNHGSSGGPVLAKNKNSYNIAGVMVAVNKGRFSLMVPSKSILQSMENLNCN